MMCDLKQFSKIQSHMLANSHLTIIPYIYIANFKGNFRGYSCLISRLVCAQLNFQSTSKIHESNEINCPPTSYTVYMHKIVS